MTSMEEEKQYEEIVRQVLIIFEDGSLDEKTKRKRLMQCGIREKEGFLKKLLSDERVKMNFAMYYDFSYVQRIFDSGYRCSDEFINPQVYYVQEYSEMLDALCKKEDIEVLNILHKNDTIFRPRGEDYIGKKISDIEVTRKSRERAKNEETEAAQWKKDNPLPLIEKAEIDEPNYRNIEYMFYESLNDGPQDYEALNKHGKAVVLRYTNSQEFMCAFFDRMKKARDLKLPICDYNEIKGFCQNTHLPFEIIKEILQMRGDDLSILASFGKHFNMSEYLKPGEENLEHKGLIAETIQYAISEKNRDVLLAFASNDTLTEDVLKPILSSSIGDKQLRKTIDNTLFRIRFFEKNGFYPESVILAMLG